MKKSPAYILGALDALVKSGAVSPDYAAGAASVLVKDAGLWWDSSAQDFNDRYMDWKRRHPGKTMSPDRARQMALSSRNWWSRIGPNGGWGNWFTTRMGKWTYGLRHLFNDHARTAESYEREYQDAVNQNLKQYADGHWAALPNEAAGALQDAFVRDAQDRVLDTKSYMSDADREAAGFNEDYIDKFRFQEGSQAIRGGAYKPQFDKKTGNPAPGAAYGKDAKGNDLSQEYGANKSLFYTNGYKNPLDD